MPDDIRIATSWLTHPKRRKLEKRLGPKACLSFIDLLLETRQNKPTGRLDGWTAEDIAISAQWDGDSGVFLAALVDLRLIDMDGNGYVIHNWEEHNPYAVASEARIEKARNAANKMWEKRKEGERKGDATSKIEQCSEHATRMPLAETSNAPPDSPRYHTKEKEKPLVPKSADADSRPLLFLPVRGSPPVGIFQKQVDDWQAVYSAVDVLKTLQEIRIWNEANPTKQKTKSGVLKHITGWLARAQNNGGGNFPTDTGRRRGTETIDDWAKRKEAELEAGGVQAVH